MGNRESYDEQKKVEWKVMKAPSFKIHSKQPIMIDGNRYILVRQHSDILMIYSYIIGRDKWLKCFKYRASYMTSISIAINENKTYLYAHITGTTHEILKINILNNEWKLIHKYSPKYDGTDFKPFYVNGIVIHNQYHMITIMSDSEQIESEGFQCKHFVLEEDRNSLKLLHIFHCEYEKMKQFRLIFNQTTNRLLLFWMFSGSIYEYHIAENKWYRNDIGIKKKCYF